MFLQQRRRLKLMTVEQLNHHLIRMHNVQTAFHSTVYFYFFHFQAFNQQFVSVTSLLFTVKSSDFRLANK